MTQATRVRKASKANKASVIQVRSASTCALVLLMTIRLLVQSPVPDPDVALDAATRVAVIEGALKALNDVYVFPAVAAKMVQAVRDRQQRHEYDSISRLASSRTFSAAEDFTYAVKNLTIERLRAELDAVPRTTPSPNQAGGGPSQQAVVIDDFESGTLADWSVKVNGKGGWFIYTKGQTPPDPSKSDPNFPFSVPDPPQGKFAAVTDMNGPGSRMLYRDVKLDGRYSLHLTVFYVNVGVFSSPATLDYDTIGDNQQFRIDLLPASSPVDSVAKEKVLVNIFHTSPGDPDRRAPSDVSLDLSAWQGQTVRLRLASVDNRGPLRVGVDNIRLEPIGR